jgi:hypothetical protein
MFEFQFLITIDADEFTIHGKRKNLGFSAETYIAETREVLKTIAATKTGWIVLDTIRRWNKYVRISPFEDSPFSTDACGIGGGGLTVKGEDRDLLYNRARANYTLMMLGTNLPIGAVIRFTRSRYLPGGGCHTKHSDKQVSDYTPTADEVLLHELVHAVRFTSGTMNLASDTFPDSNRMRLYDAEEEFYAILVQNIYQSELNGNLRASHQGFRTLEQELQDSFGFYKVSRRAFQVVDNFCRSNPHFTRRLCKLKVPFNPIAAYYHDKKRCQENSRSLDAGIRDKGKDQFKVLTPSFSWDAWNVVLQP